MDNYEKLCDVLKTNTLLVNSDGELLKNKVQELARKLDPSLLDTLLADSFTSAMFFTDVNGVKVFDANKFTYIVESQAFLPDSYTRFKQNIMLTDGSKSIVNSGDVVLEFPNKDCVLEFDSTDTNEKRKEVFLNETLAKPEIDTLLDNKAFCNAMKHTINGSESVDEITMDDNFIIKGNNLLALHSLYPKYKGKIKLMYWDILYNTQNDQVPYNDSFKHSSWLTMMKNRLEIGKKLLRDDGVICLQCDDNEQAYLKVLCDEIFGRENFVNTICLNMSNMSGQKVNNAINGRHFPKIKEYLLVYAINKSNIFINVPKTQKRKWDDEYNKIIPDWKESDYELFKKDLNNANSKIMSYPIYSLKEYAKKYNIDLTEEWKFTNAYRIFATKPNKALLKKGKTLLFKSEIAFIQNSTGHNKLIITDFNKDTSTARIELVSAKENSSVYYGDIWMNIATVGGVTREGSVKLTNGKKPERLIYDVIRSFTNEYDIVLDAYLGSGTTAAVAHKMGRRYIGIEQLDSHYDMSIERMNNVINGDQTGISKSVNWEGGGSFIAFELAQNSQKIVDKIINTDDEGELKDVYDDLINSPFVLYRVAIKAMEKFKYSFDSLNIEDKKKLLVSIIDKNTLYMNYSDIDNEDYNSLTDSDKEFTKNFYRKG